jgi:transposase
MPRRILGDKLWAKRRRILLGERIHDKSNLRWTVEGMLYRIRVGCPWRDLPSAFGPWNQVYKRFRAWCQSGKWWRVFQAAVSDPDLEWAFIDGTDAQAHQHSAGAVGTEPQAIGTSRAGQTTQLYLAMDAYGLPNDFEITGGQVADCTVAPALIRQLPAAEAIIGDNGYDSASIRQQIEAQASHPVIPRRRNSTRGNQDLDRGLYRYRHWVENTFARLKHYRGVASRFDKLKQHYESVVAMACTLL